MSALISAEEWLAAAPHSLRPVDCRFSLADVNRGAREYEEGHLPGAVYAHLERDLSGPVVVGQTGRHPLPEVTALAQKLGAWGIDETVTVVAYDDSTGAFAARLWWLLHYLGHDQVRVLDGGLAAYVRAGGALEQSPPQLEPRRFIPRVRPELIATVEEVEARSASLAPRLYDARAADRFRGENETIDPIPGHIPGAQSLPFAQNLGADGFLPPAQLRHHLLSAMGDEAQMARSVVYCGSGVTACHHVLAAAVAGLPWPRLFPGSYSEWIAAGSRPVARG